MQQQRARNRCAYVQPGFKTLNAAVEVQSCQAPALRCSHEEQKESRGGSARAPSCRRRRARACGILTHVCVEMNDWAGPA